MNSRNEYLRKMKEEAVFNAIQFLSDNGINRITNKKIVDTIIKLYPIENDDRNRDRHINVNTLSKSDYYKENIPKWIAKIKGVKPNEKSLKAAQEAKARKLREKLKTIERYANELITGIVKGEIECNKFTKSFLREWIVVNKQMELSTSIFSSTDEYIKLFEKIETKFYSKDRQVENHNGISTKDYGKLKRDLKIANSKLEHFVTNLYVSENNSNLPVIETSGNQFKGIYLNKDDVYQYLDFMRDKLESEIDAGLFFKSIVAESRIKK
ncbi:hypothetical protein ABE096_22100 [Robertmurraya massiliosenegalensis]|uniref:hypothetical protein n=1 Tax=Robertmurraya TaxID=2837507 RepID=UPI0039A58F8E